jgi:ceramide glucosyltransferase
MGYGLVAWIALRSRFPGCRTAADTGSSPAVTVLKPLCGTEHEIYECLRSFCEQDHPSYQVVFGLSDGNDPAAAVVQRLQQEFPGLDLQLVIDRRLHGSSRKVSNLINMMAAARHDYLVISDSDVRVAPDYLSRIVAPLIDPSVGIVTCAYRGRPRSGLWSLLGSLFINEWFIPSVRVAAMFGSRAFAFGATIALRRDTLNAIGGFLSIRDQLADDYRLGEQTRALGLRTVLSDMVVETSVDEGGFVELCHHELRWMRTIRAVRPGGYAMSFITFGPPVAALGCLLAGGAWPALAMLGVSILARILVHLSARERGSSWLHLLALPLRDLLSLGLWLRGFMTRHVRWREVNYRVGRDGSAEPVVRI